MRPKSYYLLASFLVLAGSADAKDAGKFTSGIGNYKNYGAPVRQTSAKDCGQVIIEYQGTKTTKTVCSEPWTGPTGSPESGSGTSSAATSTQS